MNTEEKIKLYNNIQIIKVDSNGSITETDHNFFTWEIETSIYDAHPFFEILKNLSTGSSDIEEFNFPCIHLEQDAVIKICDITFKIHTKETIIIIFDYTVKYQELNAIAQQKNESILRAKSLELKNRFLLEKEKFKNSFIANINHEIRTPLTSILGFIEVLEKTKLEFEQEELTRIIKIQSKHLSTLLDDMVDISKIESGTIHIVEERFSFIKLIQGFKDTYAALAKEKGLQFAMKLDESIPEYVIGDRTRLYQILNNVLTNAFKFTEEGSITFTISKNYQRSDKTSITFEIKDTGLGFHTEHMDEIFKQFTRLHRDKPIKGTGLGLAIVKDLTDLLKGEIKVASEPEKGTVFRIKIPFKVQVRKTAPERKKKKYTLPETKKKFRVLLVEDEESTQFLVMKILISQGIFFVDVALNGQQAISYMEKRNYDTVLMDLTLSGLDGYQITHKIRNNYGDAMIAEVPIIGFTARATESERDKCLRSGMDDFIAKPFEQEELLYKIIKQIAKKAAV